MVAINWMLVSSQNSYVETTVTVFGSGAFGRWLNHECGVLMNRISPYSFHHMRTLRRLIIYEPGSSPHQMLNLPSALGLVSLQNCKKSIPVYRPLVYDYHACLVAQSCLTLCNPMHCSPWGSSVQGRVPWSGLPLPFLGDLPDPGAKPVSPVSLALQADSLPAEPSEKPFKPLACLLVASVMSDSLWPHRL